MKTFFLSALALFVACLALAIQPSKTHSITGKVVDAEDGKPLIGVSILLKGTSTGTISQTDGTFTISSPTPCATLVFSYTGYETFEFENACEGQPVEIQLKASHEQLSEIMVVAAPSRMKLRKSEYASQGIAALRREPANDWNTEDYDPIEENRFLSVRHKPLSTFSIDVDAASYSNVRRFIRNGQLPPPDAVRIEEMVNYFDYEYPAPDPASEVPFSVVSEVNECPWNPDHKLLLIGLRGRVLTPESLPAANLVFLIDVSGSMSAANKLPLVKSSLKLLVNQLRPQDRVAIVVYAGAAGLVLPSTPGNDRQKILSAIDNLEAGGSTAGAAGIRLAYQVARENFVEGGNNRVILCTDGDFNVGTSSDAELVRLIEQERQSGVFLTVLGYGMGNYKDNKMQKLANAGNGNHYYIDDIDESRKVLVEEFGGTMYTIAKDVKLQLEFNPLQVQGYRLVGYENRLLRDEDFKDDRKDAGEMGSGHRVTVLYELIPAGKPSPWLADIDELKYQQTKIDRKAAKSGELLTLKARWKDPDGHKSKEREWVVVDTDAAAPSDNFRFAAAVAEFGMLLRNSEFKGKATYAHAAELAWSAIGPDPHGYRRELVRLIETVEQLAVPLETGK